MAGGQTQAIPFLVVTVPRNGVLCAKQALRLAIARRRRGSRGREPLSTEGVLHIAGVTAVEDRCRDSPQADFTACLAVNRVGLLVRPKLIAIH
jgi:hypothetical protein